MGSMESNTVTVPSYQGNPKTQTGFIGTLQQNTLFPPWESKEPDNITVPSATAIQEPKLGSWEHNMYYSSLFPTCYYTVSHRQDGSRLWTQEGFNS